MDNSPLDYAWQGPWTYTCYTSVAPTRRMGQFNLPLLDFGRIEGKWIIRLEPVLD